MLLLDKMTPPLEKSFESELCPLLKTLCIDADDEQLENYCACNYENCEKYIASRKQIEEIKTWLK